MATPTRRTRKSPSTTTRKSSETQIETPESDSQASELQSDETSTQTEESTSSPSSEDENEKLFAEADAAAAQDAPEEPEEGDDPEESEEVEEPAPVAADGDVVTFEVELPNLSAYTFQGVIQGNTIVVIKDATRSFRLPGSKRSTGQVLAHHKGQLLPLSSFERFIKNGK